MNDMDALTRGILKTTADAGRMLGLTQVRVGQLCVKGILPAERRVVLGIERWLIATATLVAFRKIKRRPGRPKS